jgi:glycosyltransferase involved in cell wall biosynthesis
LFRRGPKRALVFAAGRLWDRAKNVVMLQAVAPRLTWPVSIAGDSLPGTGRLSDAEMRERLAAASILAHAARYEPFGLVPLEAALSGCALVLGDIPSLREVWGDAATYVDPDDEGELLAALTTLIESPALRHQQAQRAYRRAQRYTADAMAARYVTLYSTLGIRGAAAPEELPCAS